MYYQRQRLTLSCRKPTLKQKEAYCTTVSKPLDVLANKLLYNNLLAAMYIDSFLHRLREAHAVQPVPAVILLLLRVADGPNVPEVLRWKMPSAST